MLVFVQVALSSFNKYGIKENEYDSHEISMLIETLSPHYWINPPQNETIIVKLNNKTQQFLYQTNLSNFLDSYIIDPITTDYSDYYYYAALQFINGVKLLFGFNGARNQIQGLIAMQAASRFGCNEATLFLGNGHEKGALGLSKSPKLAYHYYLELYKSWISGVSRVNQYEYATLKRLNTILQQKSDQDRVIPKAERQHLIMSAIRDPQLRDIQGNNIAVGALSGLYGFEERSDIAAAFAYLSAISSFDIQLDKKRNGIDALLQQEMNELAQAAQNNEEFAINNQTETEGDKKKLQQPNKHDIIEKYTYDGVNLLEFDSIVPLSKEGLYIAIQELCKHTLEEIYQDYKYFDTFNDLRKRLGLTTSQKPSKEQLLEHMLQENRSFAYYATRIFVDRTDRIPQLGFLRHKSNVIDKGPDEYVRDLLEQFEMRREYEESCQRRGQSFAILRYFILRNPELLPKEVVNENMHRKLARILSLGSAYHLCHMGLTGTAFDDIDGFRPDNIESSLKLQQLKLNNSITSNLSQNINNTSYNSSFNVSSKAQKNKNGLFGNKKKKNIVDYAQDSEQNQSFQNNSANEIKKITENNTIQKEKNQSLYINVPDLKSALMALDIASQAGSFEASYYEALLLNGTLYELGSQGVARHLFLYHNNFRNLIFQSVKGSPHIVRTLLSHAAHGELLGGQFLQGMMEFTGFGGYKSQKAQGITKMKKIAQRITFEWNIQDIQEQIALSNKKTDWQKIFCQLFVQGITGNAIALSNAAKIMTGDKLIYTSKWKKNKKNDLFINFLGRNNLDINMSFNMGLEALFVEIQGAMQYTDADLIDACRRMCQNDVQTCIFVLYGFQGQKLMKQEFNFIRKQLVSTNEWLILLLAEKLGGKKLQDDFAKYKKKQMHHYDDFKTLSEAVDAGKIISTKQFIINNLRKSNSKVSKLVYDCYFSTYEEQNRLLKSFPHCFTINSILDNIFQTEIQKAKMFQVYGVNKSSVSKEIKNINKRFDFLVSQFLLEFPDKHAEFLFSELQSLVCDQKLNLLRLFWNLELKLKYTKQDFLDIVIVHNNMQEYYLNRVTQILNVLPRQYHQKALIISKSKTHLSAFVSQTNHMHTPYINCQVEKYRSKQNFVFRELIHNYLIIANSKLYISIGSLIAGVIVIYDTYSSKKINNLRIQAEEAELEIYDEEEASEEPSN